MTTYDTEFTPVTLYIKRHSTTGLLYFGKTIKSNPVKYQGSGKHWTRHIRKHGKHLVEHIWDQRFVDKELLIEFALFFSEFFDIEKDPRWANLMHENGLDGQTPGSKLSDEHKAKIKAGAQGRTVPEHERIQRSVSQKGKTLSDAHRAALKEAWKKRVNRAPRKGKITTQ